MADESKQQTQDTDQDTDDVTEEERTETERTEEKGDDTPTKLLKALQEERDARRDAERKVKAFERKQRDAEAERAMKAGDLESVIKTKDGEIADLNQRIADLERERDEATLTAVRERVAAKYRLPAELAEVLRGATEDELTEHAKRLAKVVAVKAPDTEAGKGAGGGDAKAAMRRAHEDLAAQNPRYTPF